MNVLRVEDRQQKMIWTDQHDVLIAESLWREQKTRAESVVKLRMKLQKKTNPSFIQFFVEDIPMEGMTARETITICLLAGQKPMHRVMKYVLDAQEHIMLSHTPEEHQEKYDDVMEKVCNTLIDIANEYADDPNHPCAQSIIAAMMNGVVAYYLQQELTQSLNERDDLHKN